MSAVPLEAAEAAGIALVEEVVWDDIDVLRPGMDFKNGVTFVTMPATLNIKKTVGKGKAAKDVIEKQPGLAIVTSKGEQFAYVPEVVAQWGYGYPETVVVPKERRWSRESITAFRAGETTAPNPATLWHELRKVYEEYIEFAREEYYDLMPMFIMGSYLFRLYKAVGYLHFNGTAESGKSQNLRILDALAFNTQWASSMSSAALYRSIAGHPGTVCIDEAEGFEGERGEELRRILNAGYLDGSTVKRAEKGPGDVFVVKSYESYGPKAIASINVLDAVIGSRCLIVAMRPAIRKIAEFDKDLDRWERLRDRLYLWLMHHGAAMAEVIERWNSVDRYTRAPNLIGRAWQITQMYVTVADYIDSFDKGDRCARLIAFFGEYFADRQRQQDATDRIRLVLRVLPEVLRLYAPQDGGFFPLKDVHEVVSGYLEEDQKEYYKTRQLSKHLDVLGFKKRRAHKKGQQVWLDPAHIRQEFRQRRVEPQPEDEAWLAGETEYAPVATGHSPISQDRISVWADIADEE